MRGVNLNGFRACIFIIARQVFSVEKRNTQFRELAGHVKFCSHVRMQVQPVLLAHVATTEEGERLIDECGLAAWQPSIRNALSPVSRTFVGSSDVHMSLS